MTQREKEIIKNYEQELWDELQFYKKSLLNFSNEESINAIKNLIDSCSNKWYAVHVLVEKLTFNGSFNEEDK
jgi:hypothetical protein